MKNIQGASIALMNLIETVEHDVNHEWENYSLEAMQSCKKLQAKLEGKVIRFSFLGRPDMRGIITSVMDSYGSVKLLVTVLLRRGGKGLYKEIYLSDIIAFEKSTQSKGGS